MKTPRLRAASAAVLTVFLLFFVLLNLGHLRMKPWQTRLEFRFPDLVASDSRGRITLIDNGDRRIIRMKQDGAIEQVIEGSARGSSAFYEAWELAVAPDDTLYILNTVRDLNDGFVSHQDIRSFSPGSRKPRVLLARDYTSPTNDSISSRLIGSIKGIYHDGRALHFLDITNENRSALYQVTPAGEAVFKRFLQGGYDLVDVKGRPEGEVYYTLKNGRIYQNLPGPGQGLKTLGLQFEVPWSLYPARDGNLFVSDLGRQTVSRIASDGSVSGFLGLEAVRKADPATTRFLIRNFAGRSDGGLVCVDELYNRLILTDSKGTVSGLVTHGRWSLPVLVYRALVWLAIPLALVCVVYLIYFMYWYVFKRRLSIAVKQLLVFIPVIAGAIAITGFRIYHDTFDRYRLELSNRLVTMAQLGAPRIDGNALARLNTPADYQNRDYQAIKESMLSVLNNNENPWNESLYCIIYRVRQGVFYYTVDLSGYFGVVYPYFNDQKVHHEAYVKGIPGTTVYEDREGTWLIGVAPVRDSRGNITGVFETGMNMNVTEELNRLFLKNLLAGTGLSLVFFLLLFLILTFVLLFSIRSLRDAVAEVAQGKYDKKIRHLSHDEIGELGDGFNRMTGQINSYIEEISSLNRTLEIKVAERTAELEEERNKLLRQNTRMENEIVMARRIQLQMIPGKAVKKNLGFFYKPMEIIGGDFYDFIDLRTQGRMGIFVSDVSGHGVPAALITSMIKTTILQTRDLQSNPAQLMTKLNDVLLPQSGGNFITAFYGVFEPETRVLHYANAGHNAPYLIHNGQISQIKTPQTGLPLAVLDSAEMADSHKSYTTQTVTLEKGAKVIFYTDGLTEAFPADETGGDFESTRLNEVFISLAHLPARLFVAEVYLKLVEFRGNDRFNDDICIICLDVE